MARILEHWRTLTAAFFSLALIASVTFLIRDIDAPRSAQASAESELLKAIATKDSDGDGLPDWEEALYGADPSKNDTFNLGMSDSQAVAKGLIVPKAVANLEVGTTAPTAKTEGVDEELATPPVAGTLTAAFAEQLYAAYRVAREAKNGGNLTPEETSAIASEAFRALAASVKPSPDFKTTKDITISGSGIEALRAYAISVEAILKKNTRTASVSEIAYLQQVVEKGNEEAVPYIIAIAKSYRESAVGIANLPVPKELADEALDFVNALARLGEVTTDFAQVRVDPLATMLALEQYPQAVLALAQALIDSSAEYSAQNITFSPDAPGASFVNLIANVAAKQAAAKKI